MGFLDSLRNALQPTVSPTGDRELFARLRCAAYRELFGGDPVLVLPPSAFCKIPGDVQVEVRVYEFTFGSSGNRVQAAVSSGMSDYVMTPPKGERVRREVIQYFSSYRPEDLIRLHGFACVPIAAGFALDYFQTAGPVPGEWPGALFIPPLVRPHAEFKMQLDSDEVCLLWYVPLRQAEVDFKVNHGVDALLDRMQKVQLPWIFDSENRADLVSATPSVK
jgi:hypothetical protein